MLPWPWPWANPLSAGVNPKPESRQALSFPIGTMCVDTTTHGFGTTFRVWAAEKTDFRAEVVEYALAHLDGSETVRAYLRTTYFTKRSKLMQVTGFSLGHVGPSDTNGAS